jgi:hypothetical protein
MSCVRVALIINNDDHSIRDTAHALWREGRDRVAIAGALLEFSMRLTGTYSPDAAVEALAPVATRDEARAAVQAALYRLEGGTA